MKLSCRISHYPFPLSNNTRFTGIGTGERIGIGIGICIGLGMHVIMYAKHAHVLRL